MGPAARGGPGPAPIDITPVTHAVTAIWCKICNVADKTTAMCVKTMLTLAEEHWGAKTVEYLMQMVDLESADDLASVWQSLAVNKSKNKSNNTMTIKLAIANWCQDKEVLCKEDDYPVVNTNMVNMFHQLNFISSDSTKGSGLLPFNMIPVQHPTAGTAANCAGNLMVAEVGQLSLKIMEATCFYQASELHILGTLEETNAQLCSLTVLVDVMWKLDHRFPQLLCHLIKQVQSQICGFAQQFAHQPRKAIKYASHVLFTIECKI
jgi:hypothetical protein